MKTGVLTLATVAEASPKAAADFLDKLRAAVLDCKENPDQKKDRHVKLKLLISPRPGDPDDVVITPVIESKTPAKEHESFYSRGSKTGQLKFDFAEEETED
jgi:hypothetical protein